MRERTHTPVTVRTRLKDKFWARICNEGAGVALFSPLLIFCEAIQ